eukprot:1594598-Pyramimonas_sp.AAC.1
MDESHHRRQRRPLPTRCGPPPQSMNVSARLSDSRWSQYCCSAPSDSESEAASPSSSSAHIGSFAQ